MLVEAGGVAFPIWAPPLVAFGISFFTSIAGVSGAFLLVPVQMAVLGSSPSISATTHVFNALAIPGGLVSYGREGRLVWPLAAALAVGTLPGVFLGAFVRVTWLREPGPFKLFVAAVLAWIGLRLLRDSLRGSDRRRRGGDDVEARFLARARAQASGGGSGGNSGGGSGGGTRVTGAAWDRRGVRFELCDQPYRVPLVPLLVLSGAVGLVGGIYGIGGGSIIAPFLVSLFGLPVYAVAGPALLATFVTSAGGIAAFHLLAPLNPGIAVAPDWSLAALFALGGVAGMYLGGRAQKHVPAGVIRGILTFVTLLVAVKYASDVLRFGG